MIEPLTTAGEKILQLLEKMEELKHSKGNELSLGKIISLFIFALHSKGTEIISTILTLLFNLCASCK